MSWFNLKNPMGTNYVVDPNDIISTKTALNQLGYYDVPSHRGIDDWTDDAMFDGIKAFQKANGLKVDGFMRPGGIPPNVSPNMPVLTRPLKQYHGRPYWQGGSGKKGGPVVEGVDPRNGGTIRPPRGPY